MLDFLKMRFNDIAIRIIGSQGIFTDQIPKSFKSQIRPIRSKTMENVGSLLGIILF